jgi:CRISPR-associated exonuclease Cas4
MFSESDLLPLSALQHFVFCERQAALIHLERAWSDNALTVEGSHLHDDADSGKGESRKDLRISRGLPLRNLRLGLAGIADVVEWHRLASGCSPGEGVDLPGTPGRWRPFPVEYKRGKPKRDRCDEVQLCGQALCLEEMTGLALTEGALFYGKTKRRLGVALSEELRRMTEVTADRLRAMLASGRTPAARRQPKCNRCSLLEICRPDAQEKSARHYLAGVLGWASRADSGGSS